MSIEHVPAGDPGEISDALTTRFTALHGRAPVGVFAAPGRVNLIGEHVDYNDGACLPMALPHATYAAVAVRDDDRVTVSSVQQESGWAGTLDTLGPGRVDGWAAYVAGVVWALQQEGWTFPGLDVAVDSRVPVGAGLSSSAALECSVALGLAHVAGVEVDDEVRRTLVRACIRAEAEVAGAPTGGMDQTVAMFGLAGHALLLDCRDWTTTQLPWDPAAHDLELLVVDTRASHELTDGGYASRRADCEEAARALGVSSLREVEDRDGALKGIADERVRRRARHVLTEMTRVDEAAEVLRAGDYAALGRLFDASHESMRDGFEISCDELDAVVDTCRAHGALGARMTGGGFGGSAIALLPRAGVDAAAAAVAETCTTRGWPAPGFLHGVPSDGAHRLR